MVSACTQDYAARISAVFNKSQAPVQSEGLFIIGKSFQLKLLVTCCFGTFDTGLRQRTPYAKAPVSLVDTDAKPGAVSDFFFISDTPDPG